ncbi:DJ-1 family glyoxalase III [Kiritimatiella glycovorans]|uniref:Chaperone protein YajL n=1 Tax=Kiritimatiella glycovorans TaxID=1307763 RepID=A0A0G3EHP3_9BACT|nr:DJ-1 family glyoxalase III [Kiritimatiella glycovorans]AKJ64315.1 Chaperone protein YajL [Kiritimatiella glycovorans]
MSRILIVLAEGCEEMEAVIAMDVLRRAGLETVAAGLEPGVVTASRGTKLCPDCAWNEADPGAFDMLILPGGMGGAERLCGHEGVLETLRAFDRDGTWIGAICAAALVLHRAGILTGKRFTCYPGIEEKMSGVTRSAEPVVVDRHLITSQGPGTAFEFALRIIAELHSPRKADEVRRELLLGGAL